MTQKGKVVSVNGERAVVRVMRRSACDGCRQKNLCAGTASGCAEEKPVEAFAKNTAGASVGDSVLLSSDSNFVLGIAFCVFVLPLLSAFAAYFAAASFFGNSAVSYVAAAAAFTVFAVVFCFVFNRMLKKKQYIEIIKILDEDN